jgi:predicted alpha/beta-fold hydrolase
MNWSVIPQIGFSSVEEYYKASSALQLLPEISKPTLIIYAADDPFFALLELLNSTRQHL